MTEDSGPSSEIIAEGVAGGMERSKTRINDRRLLIIFLMLAVTCGYLFWRNDQQNAKIERQQKAAQKVCQQLSASNSKFDELLDQLAANIRNSVALTPEQKTAALASYGQAHLAIVDCSALSG